MGDTRKAYSQADHEAFPNAAVPSTYAMTDVDSLAEYAARRYAKSPQEYMQYIEYYRYVTDCYIIVLLIELKNNL